MLFMFLFQILHQNSLLWVGHIMVPQIPNSKFRVLNIHEFFNNQIILMKKTKQPIKQDSLWLVIKIGNSWMTNNSFEWVVKNQIGILIRFYTYDLHKKKNWFVIEPPCIPAPNASEAWIFFWAHLSQSKLGSEKRPVVNYFFLYSDLLKAFINT